MKQLIEISRTFKRDIEFCADEVAKMAVMLAGVDDVQFLKMMAAVETTDIDVAAAVAAFRASAESAVRASATLAALADILEKRTAGIHKMKERST